jgi:hypothetical protein
MRYWAPRGPLVKISAFIKKMLEFRIHEIELHTRSDKVKSVTCHELHSGSKIIFHISPHVEKNQYNHLSGDPDLSLSSFGLKYLP